MKLPERKYMERRIPLSAFQPPNFENKKYLVESVKIAEEIVEIMQPDSETCFKVCTGYLLSSIRRYLLNRGFHVEEVKIISELQERIEGSFVEWCKEVGVPQEILKVKRRFHPILEWVAQKIEIRESLVKTGWKSWREKWRKVAYKIHLQRMVKS